MKINLKDYNIKKISKIKENTAIYEDFTDNLSKAWNELSNKHFIEDKYKDLKYNMNMFKVEIDTLLTTYDLINKDIIKTYDVSKDPYSGYNINIITPCIDLLNKGIDIINKKNHVDEEIKKRDFVIKIRYKNSLYIDHRQLKNGFNEQICVEDDYEFKILGLDKWVSDEITNVEDWEIPYLKKFVDFVIDNEISMSNNIEYLNLYLSKMYILNLNKNSVCTSFGKILDDGYGEIVFLIDRDIIYKIVRQTKSFHVYKNESLFF
jgi:hypothetical protein